MATGMIRSYQFYTTDFDGSSCVEAQALKNFLIEGNTLYLKLRKYEKMEPVLDNLAIFWQLDILIYLVKIMMKALSMMNGRLKK